MVSLASLPMTRICRESYSASVHRGKFSRHHGQARFRTLSTVVSTFHHHQPPRATQNHPFPPKKSSFVLCPLSPDSPPSSDDNNKNEIHGSDPLVPHPLVGLLISTTYKHHARVGRFPRKPTLCPFQENYHAKIYERNTKDLDHLYFLKEPTTFLSRCKFPFRV